MVKATIKSIHMMIIHTMIHIVTESIVIDDFEEMLIRRAVIGIVDLLEDRNHALIHFNSINEVRITSASTMKRLNECV
jgi:hypothetical protein